MKPTGSPLLSLCIIVVSLLVSVGEGAALSQSTTITHQAHSFDDIGEWRQLIAKGTNFIKVDLKWVDGPRCKLSPRVLNNDTRGCYFLTHDPVVPDAMYYTSYDMVAFVIDPANRYLFYNKTFMLYISFKNNRDRYPPANLTQSAQLQIQFIMNFTNHIRAANLTKFSLVYDGMYLDEKGRAYPWPRTYGFSVSDVANKESCLYSNKSMCKYTAVLNTKAHPLPFVDPGWSITRMCKYKFFKFNESAYPWVFYEPTDQRSILNVLDAYLLCGQEHEPGFAISINVDPVQYDVYAGTRSGKAWNARLFDDAKWAHSFSMGFRKSMLSFATIYLTKENKIVYSLLQGTIDNSTKKGVTFPFGAIQEAGPFNLIVPNGGQFAISPFHKLKTFHFAVNSTHYVFVSDFKGFSVVYEVTAIGLTPLLNVTMTHKQSESVTLVEVAGTSDGRVEVQFLQGYASFRDVQCSFFIQWWTLIFHTDHSFYEILQVGDPVCAAYSPRTLPLPTDSASIIITPTPASSPSAASYCASSTHSGIVLVSSHKNIHGGILCVDAHTTSVKVCTDRTCNITQSDMQQISLAEKPNMNPSYPNFTLPKLDVGTFPSLSVINLPYGGEPAVLEVHGDGFCYNSDWNNKKSHPSICEIDPVSVRYVLNYNYGTLKEWITHIAEHRGLITSCDGGIYHGVYDEGSLPSAFMFVDKNREVRMVATHTGFPTGAIDYYGCSYPISYDGGIVDGIVLPSLSLMLGGTWEVSAPILKRVTPKNNFDSADYYHEGQVYLSTAICDMCKQALFNVQLRFQNDYELFQAIAYKMSDMCTVGQLLIGDGTVVGCKNLILLYVPALAADLSRGIFSPINCELFTLCGGNGTSIFADLASKSSIPERPVLGPKTGQNNSGVPYSPDVDVELMDPIAAAQLTAGGDEYADREVQEIISVLHTHVKAQLKELLGW